MTFTESAAKEIKKIMLRDGLSPETHAVRMGVKGGGCSGLTYTLDFDDRQRKIFTRKFTAKQVGSLVLGKQPLLTGVFRVPVYVSSKDVRITVSSDSWLPLSLQSADYEAYQVLRNQRI